jgi:hypothetical protein
MKPALKKDNFIRFGFFNNRFNSFFLDVVRTVTIATPRVVFFKGSGSLDEYLSYKRKSVLSIHVVFNFLASLVQERKKFKGTVSRDEYFF